MESIAVCITTRNRSKVLNRSCQNWVKFKPENCKIFIIDDASDLKIDYLVSYRFETQQGIAKAKNKCLELAEGFDHVFLVDDDVFPKVMGWELPYINSGVNHLALTFEKNSKGQFYSPSVRKEGVWNGLNVYKAPNGCFLYLTKEAIKTAGGMRPEFGIWGFEHVEYSQRIHLLGLIPYPYMDIPNSLNLIHVLDYFGQEQSSIPSHIKRESGKQNLKVWETLGGKAEFVPYK